MRTVLNFDPTSPKSLDDFKRLTVLYGFSGLDLDLTEMNNDVWSLRRNTEKIFTDYSDAIMVFNDKGLMVFYSKEDLKRYEANKKTSKAHYVNIPY